MNLELLTYFLDLSETLNFTETAERLYTTQGNVSKHISALEKELNTVLLSREHRKVELTKAGKVLIPHARQLLLDCRAMEAALLPYRSIQNAVLKIGAIPVMVNYNVIRLIAEFHQCCPKIQMEVKEVESIRLLSDLNEGKYDIAYTRIFESQADKYDKVTVDHDRFAAVLPVNHGLANQKVISLSSLKNERFLQLDKHTRLYEPFLQLCQKADFEPYIDHTGTRIDIILDFVANGMGISLMMENSIKALGRSDIKIIPLDMTIESELAFVKRKGHHSPALNSFWNFLTEKFQCDGAV